MKLYNLELHRRVNGKWMHVRTLVWAAPYPLCRGEKIKYEANTKAYFEYLKIVANGNS